MKETYKEGLMLLVGLLIGLALGGLVVYIWLADSSVKVQNTSTSQGTVSTSTNTTNTTPTNATSTNTSTQLTTVTTETFGFTAKIPSTWKINNDNYVDNKNEYNSEIAVSGPEGSVRFIFNADGFGGGMCAGVEGDASFDLSKEVDVVTKAGTVTLCNNKSDTLESWTSGSNFARTDAHTLTTKDGKMFVVIAQAKAPISENRATVLDVVKSIEFQ